MDCVFCKIASGEMKSTKVFETERLVVIKDINPQAPVHLLVIPRAHYSNMLECQDSSIFSEMAEAAIKAANDGGFAEKGFRTVINTNDEGGQTVWHLHMHILAGRALTGRMG